MRLALKQAAAPRATCRCGRVEIALEEQPAAIERPALHAAHLLDVVGRRGAADEVLDGPALDDEGEKASIAARPSEVAQRETLSHAKRTIVIPKRTIVIPPSLSAIRPTPESREIPSTSTRP